MLQIEVWTNLLLFDIVLSMSMYMEQLTLVFKIVLSFFFIHIYKLYICDCMLQEAQ